MTRKCSHCNNNGHNSKTCPNRGVKIFGVRLTDGFIRKSVSMGNLNHYASSSGGGATSPNAGVGSPIDTPDHPKSGYVSEDLVSGSSSTRERKKGVPWTEEEHRMFLLGLQKLGKGDWRGISRKFVITRTPTQVASHAQKHFIRQCNVSRRKRRSSLFDIIPDESVDIPVATMDLLPRNSEHMETQCDDLFPAPPKDEEGESMDSTNSNSNSNVIEVAVPTVESSQYAYPVVYPAFVAPFFPMTLPVWPEYNVEPAKEVTHEVLKPRAVHSKSPINVDELVGISRLSLGESNDGQATSLSLKLVEGSLSRQSAFHTNTASGSSGINSAHNPIHAV